MGEREAETRWPNTLPPDERVLDVLLGRANPPPSLSEPTARLTRELKGPELTALGDEDPENDWLRSAILLRWRLYAAMYTRPAKDEEIDPNGVAIMLRRASALADHAPAGSEWTKKHLLAAVIEFGRGRSAAPVDARSSLEPKSRASVPAQAAPRPSIAVRTASEHADRAQRSRRLRTVLVSVAFALTVLAGVAFHTYNYLNPPPAPTTPAYLPPGTIGSPESKTSPEMVRVVDDKQHDATARAVREHATATGREYVEPTRGLFILMPPNTKAPNLPPIPPTPKK